ncbi:MAG: hypothetical protein MUF51_06800 [Vicinamibacteria bacterium]|jgi:hypothetical protein|nr:hypothetical protein [Vicinamibacteria bacterium]
MRRLGARKLAMSVVSVVMAYGALRAVASEPDERFRKANELLRAGDTVQAIAQYDGLARSGSASASLYWNWAQAARARGAAGEALWALLQARELDPGDAAVEREIERQRGNLNLDPAEIAPEPLAALARFSLRFRLDWLAASLLILSLLGHGLLRIDPRRKWLATLALACLIAGVMLISLPIAGSHARATGVVMRRHAPLLDAAAATAEAIGALREGEVVPILEASGAYVRVQDSSGARGWAHGDDVRRLRPAR